MEIGTAVKPVPVWIIATNDKLVNIVTGAQLRVVQDAPKGKGPEQLPGVAPDLTPVYKLVSITGGGPLTSVATLVRGTKQEMLGLLLQVGFTLGAITLETPSQKAMAN